MTDGPIYDHSAYAECKAYPEKALYNGGILRDHAANIELSLGHLGADSYTPAFLLDNLLEGIYAFSAWIAIMGADSSILTAALNAESTKFSCIGTVLAKQGCWSFLKGGFLLHSPSNLSLLYFQNADGKEINMSIASPSLQRFTHEQWKMNQQYKINAERKRFLTIHTSDLHGERLEGAAITIEQISRDFPIGSAIAETIIGNPPYQNWFAKRFNAAVFENELKWYATEPEPGKTNYTAADQMLEFVRANQIIVRGHNIFWEDPKYTPAWVACLRGHELQLAVKSRIRSLMSKYRGEFIHWDVSNEMLHFDFYEQRIGPNATLSFFKAAHEADPLATLFMNDYNVIETCNDFNSTVDSYISRLRELKQGGVSMDGIGLEGHFLIPNPPLIRAVLDKLGTLGLPVWLTEVDISHKIDKEAQAVYLEQVLREGFSHPAVKGIMMWTALHPKGCYQMCLTDNEFHNLPAGDVVDKLLEEWKTGKVEGETDEFGTFSIHGFLGEYSIMDLPMISLPAGVLLYDYTAYTECKARPELPLYNGGILKDDVHFSTRSLGGSQSNISSPTFILPNLTGDNTVYTFSTWVKISGADSALIKAGLSSENVKHNCIGTAIAKGSCWSFLKGGFVLDSPPRLSLLYFQNADQIDVTIEIASASLQPFTAEEWKTHQQYKIDTERKRTVTIHVSDQNGDRLQGADIMLEQISKDFPFGSAIAKTILGDSSYQNWFVERFNAAVFEDELKWYNTETKPGQVNYTIPDQMLEFVRAHQIMARGHNIFWENPKFTPSWIFNLTGAELESAIDRRIRSLLGKYKGEFINWDVNNENLHYHFYEERLGPNATLNFFESAHQVDPLATLFMNEFNVVETCDDANSTVDTYIARMQELEQAGASMGGIGLQSHFVVPNPPLIRGVLDKLATLGLPIWLTEVDIDHEFDKETQAAYLEVVLREGFSHPSVKGIMLWTALHPNGCYEMCLTDNDLQNLPAGDVVDRLLKEWETGVVTGNSDEHGEYSFSGFLGEFKVNVSCGNRTATSTFALGQGDETRHFNIQL
ncbi:hypothetical protein Ancab_017373 [Ancistrocladus abbreviatus]